MAITYRWGISQLKRVSLPNPDTVNEIEAYLYGEDENGKNTTELVFVSLEVPESYSSGSFTDYDNLTQSQITTWVESVLGTEGIDGVKLKLDKKIAGFYENNVGVTTSKPTVPW